MARMQLVNIVENPKAEIIPYGTLNAPSTLWAFIPLGADDKRGTRDGNPSIVASLYACANAHEARAIQKMTPGTVIKDTFGPDHEISRQLDEGRCPHVMVISQQPARLLIWRWWEPRF
ncbi:hypothetical protein FRC08_017969 [Ceratobasidium sp. 394]|nr:hypothetical protein FRC08_017969 [Ceratobasidium sp. 394]